MTRGRLIAFEGVDGSGKSTQLARLARRLRSRGHAVVETREYTDGPIGQRIRAMARSGATVDPQQELSWFMADRRQHVDEVIAPALARGDVVLTDRYTLSSVAYQGARGLDPLQILADNEAEFPLPDLALLFEIEAAAALERVENRGAAAQPAFEKRDFLERVAEIFASLERDYIVRVDARGTPDEVAERVDSGVAVLDLRA